MKMTIRVPPPLTWHICKIVVDCLSLVVITYVLNQSRGHWLLSDAFHSAISMSLKLIIFKKNCTIFQTLMEEDSGVALELIFLAFNIRKELCGVYPF
jgi:hypothetical protein